jgi:arsenite methyltransferase
MNTKEKELSYFSVQASWGVTKHFGGRETTDELATLCHIGSGKQILEVGCGIGVTTCYLARKYGCKIISVDLSEKMIEWAEKRAQRKSLTDLIQFRLADAMNLPFEDNTFDAVICESVTAFPSDKQKAVNEYTRVAKPGGYVGMNEGTWIRPSPPDELVQFNTRTMAGAIFLTVDGWKGLLETAHLTEIVARSYQINALSQRLNEMRGLDSQDRLDRLRGIKDFIGRYLSDPDFRKYAKELTPSMKIIRNMFAYLGYGLYVGKKPTTPQ